MTVCALMLAATILPFGSQGTIRTVSLAGHDQKLHLYGSFAGQPVILASGDGGWMHLAPHVAESLAARGYFVIGLDAKSYLSNGSPAGGALSPAQIAADFATLLGMFAFERPAILAGVSEGAGLALVGAAEPGNHPHIRGVVTYGVGERNELAWHWKDSLIYLTKRVPSEPTFNATTFIPRVAPLPLAFIRSSHDEFVPAAESDRLVASAGKPVRAWMVSAGDHRFSDNLAELDRVTIEALDWIAGHTR
jgi:fermentation-respiration switch protein FrsA (DUF1100 family)